MNALDDTQLLVDLQSTAVRLRRNDPTLRRWSPLPSTLSSTLLEESDVAEAWSDCLEALAENEHLKQVHLAALPEPELLSALQKMTALSGLECLTLTGPASIALPIAPLTALLSSQPRLRSVQCHVRLVVKTVDQVQELASALCGLSRLRSLTLNVLPRCSIAAPTIDVTPVVEACASLSLSSLSLSLGYAHNPYRQPMVNAAAIGCLLQQPQLEHLVLDNFGLVNAHMFAIATGLIASTKLRSLKLYRHFSVGVQGMQALLDAVPQSSLTSLEFVPPNAIMSASIYAPPTEASTIVGMLQRQAERLVGRKVSRQQSMSGRVWLDSLLSSRDSLDSIYWLVRTQPAMLQAVPRRPGGDESLTSSRSSSRASSPVWSDDWLDDEDYFSEDSLSCTKRRLRAPPRRDWPSADDCYVLLKTGRRLERAVHVEDEL